MKALKAVRQFKVRHELRTAVKEAFDTLPSAVCYFAPNGTVKLCNAAMDALFHKIAQSDLQSLDELRGALSTCGNTGGILREGSVFIFPDGKAWQYSEREVTTAQGMVLTEAVFDDVTALHEKQQELQRQSRELQKMYRELDALSENLREMAREQELLHLKTRLHDQMNMGIAAIRQVLCQDTPSGGNADAIRQFRRAMRNLREENPCPRDGVPEFIRDAEVSGVRVEIRGELPAGDKLRRLILAVMREACINAVRHADAENLVVVSGRSENTVTLRITNDGRRPDREIVPRGGLLNLEKVIVRAGGRMEIRSKPEFMLTVTLPAGEEKGQGVRYDKSPCG